jgi:N-acetylglutamate synthase-like GNAT family acetyltransferase
MIEFTISTDKSLLDIATIHDYLSNRSYWAKGRSVETVKRSIENSLCFGVYECSGKLIGFARVLTDYAVFAYLMDVFILEEYRNKGLAKELMKHIMVHPDLQKLQRFMLATNDAHKLYSQFDFRVTEIPEKIMEIVNKPR